MADLLVAMAVRGLFVLLIVEGILIAVLEVLPVLRLLAASCEEAGSVFKLCDAGGDSVFDSFNGTGGVGSTELAEPIVERRRLRKWATGSFGRSGCVSPVVGFHSQVERVRRSVFKRTCT